MVQPTHVTDRAAYVNDALTSAARQPTRLVTSRFASVPRPAALIVAFAAGLAVGHFVFLLSDYKNVFVHPDFYQTNLKFIMRSGLAIGPSDFIDILQQREANEFRPRWLMFYLETLDHKLRMQLYDRMPIYPTLGPVTWPLQLLVTPLLLYLLLLRLTADRLAALASVAVYTSANGFLSGFTMALMPGKTLSNLVFLAAFYVAVLAAQRLRPGQLLIQSSGPWKYLLPVVLTLGLFLDELPAAAFLMVPAMFWRFVVPPSLTLRGLQLFVSNGLLFVVPFAIFLLLVLVVVPPITEQYLGYRFNYLSEIMHLDGNTRTGTSWLNGPRGPLTPAIVLENVSTLFGVSLAPRFISPLIATPWAWYPGTQVTNLPKILIFLVFFGAALFVALRARGTLGTYFRGFLVALLLFIVFLCVLSIRHIPIVTGYYYGAGFASLFAIMVGMMFSGLSRLRPGARPYAALVVLGIVATQSVNYWPINEGWLKLHNEEMGRARIHVQGDVWRSRYPIAEEERPLTRTEVNALWQAWKHGRLQRYVRENKFSASAGYLIFELREIDRQMSRQNGRTTRSGDRGAGPADNEE